MGLTFAVAAAAVNFLAPDSEAQSPGERNPRNRGSSKESGARPGEILVLLPEGRGQRQVPSLTVDGADYLAAADIAEILRATSYWRSETRKLLLRVGEHRVTVAVGNPFVLIDKRVMRMPARPFHRDGQVWTPVALFPLLAETEVLTGVVWDPGRRLLSLGGAGAAVGDITFSDGDGYTILSAPLAAGIEPSILTATADRFVVRLHGAAASPEALGPREGSGRFSQVELEAAPGAVDLVLELSGSSRGYLVRRFGSPSRLEIVVGDAVGRRGDFFLQPLGTTSAVAEPGEGRGTRYPRAAPTRPAFVVLDPGHGGEDAGTRSPGGRLEKHLSMELARRVERRLEEESGFRVTLVRERDERVETPRRVEIANATGADLLVSLHVDLGSARGKGRFTLAVRDGGGQVVYEDLESFVPGAVAASDLQETLNLVRWESAGAEHGFESQRLAQNIAARLRANFPNQSALVTRRPVWSLEGADMPAVLVELGAPGGKDPDQAMGSGETLESLAAAVAAGVTAYWAGESPPAKDQE
jgi:N-acetylmuramoyl-L-alanine amidase